MFLIERKKEPAPVVFEKEANSFEIVTIEYIELFDWKQTFLGKPVTHKLAIDVNNGDFIFFFVEQIFTKSPISVSLK